MPMMNGAQAAGFRIIRLLGAGGMGEVYLAEHPRLPRRDALKILPRDVSADPAFRQRFARESELAAGLWHPHIVGLHDRGEFAGQLWLSMDYVEGADAAQLLTTRYPAGMPPAVVGEIVAAIAGALDYAHDRGLLHRDVKPANILISEASPRTSRRILLTDFGVARRIDDVNGLTETNMAVGTPSYIAPEQLMGGPIDGRADQYALAATAFHLLTGSPPFADNNPAVVITKHLHAPPPRPGDLRADLAGCDEPFVRALAKDSSDRFARCEDFAVALQHHSGAHPLSQLTAAAPITVHARDREDPPDAGEPAPPRPVRIPAAIAGTVLALIAVGFVVLIVLGVPPEPPPEPPPTATAVVPVQTAPEPEPPPTWTPPPSTTTPWVPTTTAPTTVSTTPPPTTSTRVPTTSVSPPVSTTPGPGTGSRPAVGAACTAGQVGMSAMSTANMPVRCVSAPDGFTWVLAP